jgi:thiamine-phosphate pyrophosphorylase
LPKKAKNDQFSRRMNPQHSPIRGMYAITPDETDTGKLLFEVGELLEGGVRLLQYRNKAASKALARVQANALRQLTARFGALLIINDDVALALEMFADGVHLGRDDHTAGAGPADLTEIRLRAGPRQFGPFLIGLSCYNDFDLGQSAAEATADYIAFGSFFSSSTKPGAIRADVSLLHRAKRAFSIPVVAIGGITVENAPQLLAAGADSVAVISSLFEAGDIRARAKLFSSLFSRHV